MANKKIEGLSLNRVLRLDILRDSLVDERTLRRAFKGEELRPSSRERIRRALSDRGLLHLLPAQAR